MTGCYSTPDAGKIEVVRNGGPFDNHSIRQVICPNSGNTWVGFNSTAHDYPDSTSQRTYKISEDNDADAQPALVRTKDGVNARIPGTYFMKTAFDCSGPGEQLLKDFDDAFVNRPAGQRPWESWKGWLQATVQPIVDKNTREILSEFNCDELVTSCALRNGGNVDTKKGAQNSTNIQAVETRLQEGLRTQLKQQLGHDYFKDITFNMGPVELPEVDGAIAKAQNAFAQVAEVRAQTNKAAQQVQTQKQILRANRLREKGYSACPSCARQDELSKLPSGLNTLVFGSNSPIAIGK